MGKQVGAFIFGQPVERRMPARVRSAILRQQVQAEILIGWTQLALVLFFLVLYTIAPKPPDGMLLRPVPWILSAFLVFTLFRLALAYRRIIATWFLAGAVIADIGLLLLLIWSFHIQYAQPAAFSLKTPTLLYVFLFIALRTLRFDPSYVVIAGVSAAAGWAVLVSMAITEPSLTPPITRDFTLYLTSNRVLIGAEIDKILCILIVTAVLAVAIIRARRLLMQSVADATVAHDLTRFVPPEVASQISASERTIEPGDGEVLTASILFCDIEGFSTIAERLSPDVLMQTLNEYFAAVSEVVARNDGVLIAYQGDAMLIGFNTALPDLDHARHAVCAAIGIQEMVAHRRFGDGLELKTRCGINTGRLISGAVGTPERLLFTVYGDEVNIAARLEQLNKSFGTYVLATEHTLAAAGPGFACRPMGSVQVRGRSRPVTVFVVEGLASASA